MSYRLLFKYTSRSRPRRFIEGLESITSMVSDKENYTILCSLDEDDTTMNTLAMQEEIGRFPKTFIQYGTSKSKIDAINRDMDAVKDWDILVVMSDDMRFTAYGFDQLIREGMAHNFPDLDGFLHYPDTTARHALATMSIMGRKYYELDNYIYNPAYLSLFCDNEAMEVAQIRRKYLYMGIPIIDHQHPAYGGYEWDEQYRVQQNLWNVDEATFKERKRKMFDLYGPTPVINTDSDDSREGRAILET